MKFIEYYKQQLNEGAAGFATKENADHFISLINKFNNNKFYSKKEGDYYILASKEEKKVNESVETIEETFKDIKHHNGVTIAPGIENTAVVNIGNTIYVVDQNKQFHIRNEQKELIEVPMPEEFKDETLMQYLNDMLGNTTATGRIAA